MGICSRTFVLSINNNPLTGVKLNRTKMNTLLFVGHRTAQADKTCHLTGYIQRLADGKVLHTWGLMGGRPLERTREVYVSDTGVIETASDVCRIVDSIFNKIES